MPRTRSQKKPPASKAKAAKTTGSTTSSQAKKKQIKKIKTARKTAIKRKNNAQAKPKQEEEERQARYRTSCPQKLLDRHERASTQRMYLVQTALHNNADNDNSSESGASPQCDFVVLGSTGNVYDVALKQVPTCTCPDYARQRDLCKHILFVLLKVIGVDLNDPLGYQKAYLKSELEELFRRMQSRRVGGSTTSAHSENVMANDLVRECYAKMQDSKKTGEKPEEDFTSVKRRSLDEDCDCPICFDKIESIAVSTYCRATCGVNFHKECIQVWCKQQRKSSGQRASMQSATCPNCRQPWVGEESSDDKKKKGSSKSKSKSSRVGFKREEDYTNLGGLQGQSRVRDTSTYYESPRRRYW